jgi:hypothetical protein
MPRRLLPAKFATSFDLLRNLSTPVLWGSGIFVSSLQEIARSAGFALIVRLKQIPSLQSKRWSNQKPWPPSCQKDSSTDFHWRERELELYLNVIYLKMRTLQLDALDDPINFNHQFRTGSTCMGRADSVKLSGNLLAGHRYRKAAYDVPSKLVPVFARKWAIDVNGNSNADSEPKRPLPKAVCEHKRLLRSIRRSKQ